MKKNNKKHDDDYQYINKNRVIWNIYQNQVMKQKMQIFNLFKEYWQIFYQIDENKQLPFKFQIIKDKDKNKIVKFYKMNKKQIDQKIGKGIEIFDGKGFIKSLKQIYKNIQQPKQIEQDQFQKQVIQDMVPLDFESIVIHMSTNPQQVMFDQIQDRKYSHILCSQLVFSYDQYAYVNLILVENSIQIPFSLPPSMYDQYSLMQTLQDQLNSASLNSQIYTVQRNSNVYNDAKLKIINTTATVATQMIIPDRISSKFTGLTQGMHYFTSNTLISDYPLILHTDQVYYLLCDQVNLTSNQENNNNNVLEQIQIGTSAYNFIQKKNDNPYLSKRLRENYGNVFNFSVTDNEFNLVPMQNNHSSIEIILYKFFYQTDIVEKLEVQNALGGAQI